MWKTRAMSTALTFCKRIGMIDFELMPHQKKAVKDSYTKPDMFLAWDMGVGKTCAVIQILRHNYGLHGELRSTLVLAPLITLQNWKREFALFSKVPERAVVTLQGTGKQRIETLRKAVRYSCIVICNYESLDNDELFAHLMAWSPRIVCCDESHVVKNPKSKRARKVAMLADGASNRYLLSGTPILNNAMDLFMQYRVLDGYLGKNSTFGTNFFAFRNRYFEDANSGFAGSQHYFPKWEPRASTFEELSDRIQAKTSVVKKFDVLKSLPPLVTEQIDVELSSEQQRVYKELRKEFVSFIKTAKGEKAVIARLAMVKALRLQQVVTGFVTAGENPDSEVVRFKDVPRLRVLHDILHNLVGEHKVIVWAAFKENYRMIAEMLSTMGVGYTELHGGISAKEKFLNQDQFNKDPECRVLIGNPGAGGVGINLIGASYSVYYSRGFKLGDDLQSEARNYRKGSEVHEKITRINMVAPQTIDELVSEALSRKQQIAEEIIQWKI